MHFAKWRKMTVGERDVAGAYKMLHLHVQAHNYSTCSWCYVNCKFWLLDNPGKGKMKFGQRGVVLPNGDLLMPTYV